jgi:hypothetical protein
MLLSHKAIIKRCEDMKLRKEASNEAMIVRKRKRESTCKTAKMTDRCSADSGNNDSDD